MIIIIQKNEIIVRHKNGQSKSFIAKEMGIARNTVKAYIKEYELLTKNLSTEKDKTKIVVMQELICCKPIRKQYVKPCSVFTEALKQRFNELIKIDEERNMVLGKNKQQLTAALLWVVAALGLLIGTGGLYNYIIAFLTVIIILPVSYLSRRIGEKLIQTRKVRRIRIVFEEEFEKAIFDNLASQGVVVRKSFLTNKFLKDNKYLKETIIYFSVPKARTFEEVVNQVSQQEYVYEVEEA